MTQVFAFGHSIVYGFWDTEGGWIQRLRTFLDERALDEGEEELVSDVYNLGIPGNDTRQLLERFEEELERRLWEDEELVVILQIGANDSQYLNSEDRIRVPGDEFEQNLRSLILEAREYSEQVILIGEAYSGIEGPIPWAQEKEMSDERLERYVEVQRRVSEERNVPLIDLRSRFRKDEWLEFLEDGIHPNTPGHEEIYRLLKEKLREENLL